MGSKTLDWRLGRLGMILALALAMTLTTLVRCPEGKRAAPQTIHQQESVLLNRDHQAV